MGYLSDFNVSEVLRWNQETYWWYVVRNLWLEDAVETARKRNASLRMVDVGCGTGIVLEHFCKSNRFEYVVGLDGDERLLEVGWKKNLPLERVDFDEEFHLPVKPNLWLCCDLIEHLQDDARLLRNIRTASEKGSLLAVTVPAHPSLYSKWDEQSGHHRRYSCENLLQLLPRDQWRVLSLRHFFSFLAPAAYLKRVVFHEEAQVQHVPDWLNSLLIAIGRIEHHLPPMPFGTSLYCLAEAV